MSGHVLLIDSEIDKPFVKYRLRITPEGEVEDYTDITVPAVYIDPPDGEDVNWMYILMGMVLHLQLQTEDLHRRIKVLEEYKDMGAAAFTEMEARLVVLEGASR